MAMALWSAADRLGPLGGGRAGGGCWVRVGGCAAHGLCWELGCVGGDARHVGRWALRGRREHWPAAGDEKNR